MSPTDRLASWAGWIFWPALVFFTWHNWQQYPPSAGYDAAGHFAYIRSLAESGTPPPRGSYGATNPPVYYALMAPLWRIFKSEKAIQFCSGVFYLLSCFLLWLGLGRLKVERSERLMLTAFFALLPVTLNFSLMVFNYALANLFIFAGVVLLLFLATGRHVGWLAAAVLGAGGALTVLTAFTGAALALAGLAFLVTTPQATQPRWKLVSVYLGVALLVLIPYFLWRVDAYGCAFCVPHRGPQTRLWWIPRHFAFYFFWEPKLFGKPYFSEGNALQGMWSYLFATTFGDYWNYLVRPENAAGTTVTAAKVFTGSNWIDARRIGELRVLMLLAVPVAYFAVQGLVAQAGYLWRSRRKSFFQSHALWILGLVCVLTFAQFGVYTHKYRAAVSIHAGYLMGLFFCGCLLLGAYSRTASTRWKRRFLTSASVFSAASAYVFWL